MRKLSIRDTISKRSEQQIPPFGDQEKWHQAESAARNPSEYFSQGFQNDPNLDMLTEKVVLQAINNGKYFDLLRAKCLDGPKLERFKMPGFQQHLGMVENVVDFISNHWHIINNLVPKTKERDSLIDSALTEALKNDVTETTNIVNLIDSGIVGGSSHTFDVAQDILSELAEQNPESYFKDYYFHHSSFYAETESAAANFAGKNPHRYLEILNEQTNVFASYEHAFKIMALKIAEDDPVAFFEDVYDNSEDYIAENLNIPEEAIITAGSYVAENDRDKFFELGLDSVPELISVLEHLASTGDALPQSLDKQGYRYYTSMREDNYGFIYESSYPEDQRHPDVADRDRFDLAINWSIDDPMIGIQNKVLRDYPIHDVGNSNAAKSFVLFSPIEEEQSLFVEEIQSDFPTVLHKMKESNWVENNSHGVSAEDAQEYMRLMAEHNIAYPYLSIKALAKVAIQNPEQIKSIKISSLDAIMEMAGIGNSKKAKRVYNDIPEELGFDMGNGLDSIEYTKSLSQLFDYDNEPSPDDIDRAQKMLGQVYQGGATVAANAVEHIITGAEQAIWPSSYEKVFVQSARILSQESPEDYIEKNLAEFEEFKNINEYLAEQGLFSAPYSEYTGDMEELFKRAGEAAQKAVEKLYSEPVSSKKKSPISSRDTSENTPRVLDNIDALKQEVDSVVGGLSESIDYSNVTSFRDSIKNLAKEKQLTKKQQKQITSLIQKYVRAFIYEMIVKVSHVCGVDKIIKKHAAYTEEQAGELASYEPLEFFHQNLGEVYPNLKQKAINNMEAISDVPEFIFYGLHKRYPDVGKELSKKMVLQSPEYFFMHGLQDIYPDVGYNAAEKLMRTDTYDFFAKGLHKKYPNLEPQLAKILAETNPTYFFTHSFHKNHPQLEEAAAKSLVNSEDLDGDGTQLFLQWGLADRYPEIALKFFSRMSSERPLLFLKMSLGDKYPELQNSAINSVIKKDPAHFFAGYMDDKYPDMANEALENLIYAQPLRFFDYNLHKKYSSYGERAAKNLVESSPVAFFQLKLDELYSHLGPKAALSFAHNYPEEYFASSISKKYPELKDEAAEIIAKNNPIKFLELKVSKEYPELIEKANRNIPKMQLEFDSQNPNYKGRPQKAKLLAETMHNAGYNTFIHTGTHKELDGIANTSGEICVSSWDLSRKAFSYTNAKLVAIFEGKPSHWFLSDVYSDIMPNGLREIAMDDGEEQSDEHDEQWFNPAMKGNLLVGYGVLGDPNSANYENLKSRAQNLADKNNTNYLELSGNIWDLETIRNKPALEMEDVEIPFAKKYKNIPEMSEYAFRLSQRELEKTSQTLPNISKMAKVTSDKPAYQKKERSDAGNDIYRYDSKHISKRWDEKKNKIKKLEQDSNKLKKVLADDIDSDDQRTRAIAAIVSIMHETGMRVGNEESAREGTYGASTLKKKHFKVSGGKIKFDFPGKGKVQQNVEITNSKVIRVIKELMKDKGKDDFVFEVDGKKIWDRAVNRYLKPMGISAKDLRGFKANKLMQEVLKKQKDFDKALEEVAETVGHEPATLKNQYLDPALVEKYEKKDKMSKQALDNSTESLIDRMEQKYFGRQNSKSPTPSRDEATREEINAPKNIRKNIGIWPGVRLTDTILKAWAMLKPFLADSVVMTSGFRDVNDQSNIINRMWRESGLSEKHPDITDDFERARLLRSIGYVVSDIRRLSKSHGSGRAFDMSGGNLDEMARVARMVSDNKDIPVTFSQVLVEPKNNAVHVQVRDVRWDPDAVRAVLSSRASLESNMVKIADEDWKKEMQMAYEDFIESNPPESVLQECGDSLFGLSGDFTDDKPLSSRAWNISVNDGKLNIEVDDDMPDINISDGDVEGGTSGSSSISSRDKKLIDHNERYVEPSTDEDLEVNHSTKDEEDKSWFEKHPMFSRRQKNISYNMNRINVSDVEELVKSDPKKLFYLGLNRKKRYKKFVYPALSAIIPTDAAFYFKFGYHKSPSPRVKRLAQDAAEYLAQQNCRAFFYYQLHHRFPELGKGAVIQLIDTNPDSFFDLGLQKDYPEYESLAGHSRNIKDPHKVELEIPEWISDEPDKPISPRNKSV